MKQSFLSMIDNQSHTAVLYAASGTGKTYSLSSVAPEDLCYVNFENGHNTLISLYNEGIWDFSQAEIWSFGKLIEFEKALKNGDFSRKYLAIDSLTKLSQICLEEEKQVCKDGRQYWANAQARFQRIVESISKRAGINILLAWEEKIDGSKFNNLEYSVMPMISLGNSFQQQFPGFVDYVLHLVRMQENDEEVSYFVPYVYNGFFAKSRNVSLQQPILANWAEFARIVNHE